MTLANRLVDRSRALSVVLRCGNSTVDQAGADMSR